MSRIRHPVRTIGHSTHPLGAFLALLDRHGVTALADVRSAPHSRANPQFNREVLEVEVTRRGLRYVFLGAELGGRSDDPSCYEDGRVQYPRLAGTEGFRRGIDRLLRGAEDHRVALVCAEREPLDCHRTLLVGRALAERGVTVEHILTDGRLESHEAAMDRLLGLLGLPDQDLLRTREELVAEAIRRQAARVAYVDQRLATAAGEAP